MLFRLQKNLICSIACTIILSQDVMILCGVTEKQTLEIAASIFSISLQKKYKTMEVMISELYI